VKYFFITFKRANFTIIVEMTKRKEERQWNYIFYKQKALFPQFIVDEPRTTLVQASLHLQ